MSASSINPLDPSDAPRVAVIVPVYSGRAQTLGCLDSLFAGRADRAGRVRWRAVVVNDASPDGELVATLQEQAASERFSLIEHPANLGFPSAVNSGLAFLAESDWADADVVLLNADTLVPPGWLDKLHALAHSRADVGTVTPFSNNASICSLPFADACQRNPLLDVVRLDAAAARANPGVGIELPTGVGFCLYIKKECLRRVGPLDVPSFGRGYGEETDFCRRAVGAGFVNLLACDTYVFHEGQASFGAAEGDARRLAAEGLLHRRYPDYPRALLGWLRRDPAGPARIALSLELMRGSGVPVILMVTHRMGGGVERHVRELRDLLSGKAWVLVLRPGERADTLELEIGESKPETLLFSLVDRDEEMLVGILQAAGVGRLHVHHVAGFPMATWPLLERLALPCDLTLHDYAIINGNPTLANRAGRYDEALDPSLADDQTDPQQAACLQRLARQAQRCIVPTAEAGRHLHRALPWLRLDVRAHPDRELFGFYPAPSSPGLAEGQALRVLCLGALGREKGAEALRSVADRARRAGLPLEFVLLGTAHIPLGDSVRQLGPYRDERLQESIRRERPHLVWFPVQWPETWSYTLSAALEAGLPVLATDIGAFHDRLEGRPASWLEVHPVSSETWLSRLLEIRQLLAAGSRESWHQPSPAHFYGAGYLAEVQWPAPRAERVPMEGLARCHRSFFRKDSTAGSRQWLLALALRLREAPLLGRILGSIPYAQQRRIKRLLSRRPLH
ncbi:glycosyltransferase [Pseudomonas sp. RIT-PI-AD]|uniref:glycosyltransferase n=1 Tax=Pseudomonas sp. RIT-PI-AD TaxID=3035294 RepID=UPI0021D7FFAB|nr:glycosyltransferase [Pseudomonas sp. RIT-PI-AD]